jgi:hypothetical protein
MTGFEQLERQLIESMGRRRRRRVRLRGVVAWAAVGAAGAIAVAVAVLALVLVGHRPATRPVSTAAAPPTVAKNPALKYLLNAAEATRGQCGQATSVYLIRDLSILGVLRRPATASDRLPPTRDLGQGAYRPFIRRARSVDGATYYLWPEVWPIPGGAALVRHCAAAEGRALRRQHVPANLRAAARRGAARLFTAPTLYPGICLTEIFQPPRFGAGAGSGCGETTQEIQQGGFDGNPYPTFTAVVPDGVASVTLRYKNRSFTQRVINNMIAIRVTSERRALYQAEIWHSSTGAVIKTITRPYP